MFKIPSKFERSISGYGKDADLAILSYVERGVNWAIDNNKKPAQFSRTGGNLKISVYPPVYRENDNMKEMRKFLGCKPSVSGAMFEMAINLILWALEYGEEAFLKKLQGDK